MRQPITAGELLAMLRTATDEAWRMDREKVLATAADGHKLEIERISVPTYAVQVYLDDKIVAVLEVMT